MTPDRLLAHLRAAGVVLTAADSGRLRVDAPKGALTNEWRAVLVTHKAALLATLRVKDAHPYELNEFNQRKRVRNAAPDRSSVKVWRRSPYWQACLAATRLPSGAPDVAACDLLFAALALREGHAPDETREMLHRCTPRAATRRDYCSDVVSRVSINPASYITAELTAQYAAAHPFAWELGLK